jgi:hypothetical protein
MRRAVHGDCCSIRGHACVHYSRERECQGLILNLRPLQLGQINVTAMAALDPKADLGLAILPNPLIGIGRIDRGAGVAFDL